MAKKIDATQGNLLKFIFIYTIPLVISTILQNLFNIADKAVLGNLAGSNAVASIGATGTITALVINGAIGLSSGTAIILARYVGQKDDQKILRTINTSLITATLFGTFLAVIGVIFAPAFLSLTNCPIECYDGAVIYLRIILAAAPATLIYNYGSAILRTLGDTQRPLYYITIAGIVNVVLNVILCLVLKEKVMAVAIATVASNVISVILVLTRLSKFEGNYKLRLSRLRFDFTTFSQILRFGVPSSISNLMYPLANLQIITALNSYGVHAVAGWSAADSIQTIAAAFAGGFAMAATTFIGQNIGAQNKERVVRSFWYILISNVIISGAIGAFLYMSGRFWIGVIIGADATIAIDYGMERMFFVTLFTFVSAINQTLSHSLQAFGYPLFTSISNIAFTLGFRTVWMHFVYPRYQTFTNLMSCFLVSWLLNMTFYAIFFTFVYLRYTKKGICKKI